MLSVVETPIGGNVIRLYSSLNITEIGHLKNLLEGQGIDCMVKQDATPALFGELSSFDSAAELWILNPQDATKALEIIRQYPRGPKVKDLPEWTCAKCGEKLEGQFSACWNCGAERK